VVLAVDIVKLCQALHKELPGAWIADAVIEFGTADVLYFSRQRSKIAGCGLRDESL
jgi:hypothetical protein